MDKTAHAAQLAACIENTGDELAFSGVSFIGNVVAEPASITSFAVDDKRSSAYHITAARAQDAFATRIPAMDEYLTGEGCRYRITEKPLLSGALLHFTCARSAA